MKTDALQRLAGFIDEEARLLCLIFSYEGIILYTNRFAEQLTGTSLLNKNIKNILIDFSETKSVRSYCSGPDSKALVNISTATGLPETYYFRFLDMGDSVMAIGESNPRELETMKSSFLELNQELTNMTRQLHKTNIELKKLNDLKNHFLGVAAHDLRNPIGIIMGYSNFLLEELEPHLSAGQIEMLKTIQGTSEFMLHLLNELLDITAIESGKLHLELARLNLLDLIKKNVALNSIIAEMKNISIHVESFEILPEILADESKIIQVMNNLINNAIKYSNPNTRIRISLFLTGENITVAVADQGLGIPDAELGKLFKPFERTSVKGTRGEKSTGLGLSIVRNIILGHKGKIWVESKVGVGSTFYFSLPLS